MDDERHMTATRSQAPGDATVRKRVFRDNFIICRRRSKRIAFLEQVNLSMGVYLQIFEMFMRPRFGTLQTLQTSKRHTFRDSAFHRYRWFGGKTVSCRLCAG